MDHLCVFSSHSMKSTQWTHPRTGKKKRVAGGLFLSALYNLLYLFGTGQVRTSLTGDTFHSRASILEPFQFICFICKGTTSRSRNINTTQGFSPIVFKPINRLVSASSCPHGGAYMIASCGANIDSD